MRDPFEPTREPARTLYKAFQTEALKRRTRSVEEWVSSERLAVHSAAKAYARTHGLREPTLEEVARAERYAMGSIDYGAKWAYQVEAAMQTGAQAQ